MIDINEYIKLRDKPNQCKEDLLLIEKYNRELIDKYPFVSYGDTYMYTKMDNVPDGWRVSFGDKFLKEIKEAIIRDNYLDQYCVTDVKEKYGELRWYDNTDITDDIIDKYEDMSTKICQICGKPAEVVTEGYVAYLCNDCVERTNLKFKYINENE